MTANQWVHLVWVRNGTGTALANTDVFVNGADAGGTASNNTTVTSRTDSLQFCIGMDAKLQWKHPYYWNGQIQEIQISNAAWSPSRISLTYQTQVSTSSALSFGTPQSNSGAWPNPPALAAPANNAQISRPPIAFAWSAVTTATAYQLQVALSSGFSSTVYNNAGITSTSQTVSGLAYSTSYYWRVRGDQRQHLDRLEQREFLYYRHCSSRSPGTLLTGQ